MANSVCEVLVTESPLKPRREDVDVDAGAIVDFFGTVRRLENEQEIDGIDYEAHKAMAEHQLGQIGEMAIEKFSLHKVVLHHRIGFVRAGETSLYLQVRAKHRGAGFEASKWIVDELKKKVPIWKRPKFRFEPERQAADTAAITG
jgi:molybdopterin synthase catalytic subunit